MTRPELRHILVADDEKLIRSMLRKYLVDQGFRVSEASDGAEMRAVMEQENVDLVLLDLMMPGEDGLSLTRYIRHHSEVPIIILTGRQDPIDRVAGLEAGADDYITKPFHMREILARIRTVMRRAKPTDSSTGAADTDEARERYVFGDWDLDVARRNLHTVEGNEVPLTTGEFELLMAFLRHPGRVLKRDQLMDLVKGREWAAYDRAIDTQILRLRKKIEHDSAHPEFIKTVHGAGYIFSAKVTAR